MNYFRAWALIAVLLSVVLVGQSAHGTLPHSAPATLAQLTSAAPTQLASVPPLQLAAAAPAPQEVADGEVTLREAGRTIQNIGLRAFWAVVVLLVTVFVIRGVAFLLEKFAARNAERRLFYKRLVPIARILLWTFAIFVILRGIFRLDATGLAAAAAAIGVAVGFAAQDLLKNIFGGLVIIFDQPFQVGDKISVGGAYGEVVSIGLRSTRITTPDDNLVTVPNSQVVDGQVSNANAGALDCQVVTDLYLPGLVDEAAAKRIAYEAAVASKYVYLKKPVVVLVKDEFKETFLTRIRVKAYVLDTRYEFLLQSEITERARLEFRRQGLLKPWHGARAYVDFSNRPDVEAAKSESQQSGRSSR